MKTKYLAIGLFLLATMSAAPACISTARHQRITSDLAQNLEAAQQENQTLKNELADKNQRLDKFNQLNEKKELRTRKTIFVDEGYPDK